MNLGGGIGTKDGLDSPGYGRARGMEEKILLWSSSYLVLGTGWYRDPWVNVSVARSEMQVVM